jgi:hypothetical protein
MVYKLLTVQVYSTRVQYVQCVPYIKVLAQNGRVEVRTEVPEHYVQNYRQYTCTVRAVQRGPHSDGWVEVRTEVPNIVYKLQTVNVYITYSTHST